MWHLIYPVKLKLKKRKMHVKTKLSTWLHSHVNMASNHARDLLFFLIYHIFAF